MFNDARKFDRVFLDFEIRESEKSTSTCSKKYGDYLVELSLSVSLTFLGTPFIFTGYVGGFKYVDF